MQRIIEQKDATESEKAIREVNTGILCVPNRHLHHWLPQLGNNNSQGEYYLTDIIAMAVADGVGVRTSHPAYAWEVEGVNDKLQLAALERVYQRQQAETLMKAGVTLLDPDRIDVRGQLSCGMDVEIDVNVIFEGEVSLGDNVRIGANCVLKNCSLGEGAIIRPHSIIEDAFTVKVAAFSSAATASMPVSEIVVPGELLSSTDHVTVSLYAPVPVTVAMKLCVLPVSTLTVSGGTATEVMAYTASKAPMSTPAPCGLCVPS